MRIDFYHLQKSLPEDVVFLLASKVYDSGKKLLIRTDTAERMRHLNEQLWTLRPDSWLPHGSVENNFAGQQPVYLTSGTENPNNAEFLLLINVTDIAACPSFERTLFVFDGNDEAVLNQARAFWKEIVARPDGEAHYWAQNSSGKWEEKASAGQKS